MKSVFRFDLTDLFVKSLVLFEDLFLLRLLVMILLRRKPFESTGFDLNRVEFTWLNIDLLNHPKDLSICFPYFLLLQFFVSIQKPRRNFELLGRLIRTFGSALDLVQMGKVIGIVLLRLPFGIPSLEEVCLRL